MSIPAVIREREHLIVLWQTTKRWEPLFSDSKQEAQNKTRIEEITGCFLMVLQVLMGDLQQIIKNRTSDSDSNVQGAGRCLIALIEVRIKILKSVIASVVIKAQPPDLHKDPNRWIHLAVTTAERIWETEVTPLLQNTLLRSRPTIEQLGDIAMTWRCIHKVCEYKKETRFFAMKDVKRKLEITYSWSLEAASSVAEKRALESEYNASKRPRMEWGEEEQPIKEKMVLTSEEVGRLEEIVLAIPRSTGQIDSTAADLIPTPEDMKSLKEAGQWLEDSVLSSYLLLVCHHANGHFTEQARSSAPRWHVWSPHTHQLVESDDQSLWPPRHYPEAAVREVEMHLFPMCLDSHWVMVVMSKVEAGWSTRLVSSMTEYSSKVKNAWDDIAEW